MIQFTEQQMKALKVLSEGETLKTVALVLGVSYSRAINILNEILIKTGYRNRRELLVNAKSLYNMANTLEITQ